jgi:flagellin
MPLSINTNIASMTAQRSFLSSNAALETSFERLSTGKRVNSAVDDAAGLAIGKDLESRVSGLNQAIRNVNDGISMVQIVEGAYDEVTSILQRMRDLAVQANNGSLSSTEQNYLDTELNKLQTSLDSTLNSAKFNDVDLVDTDGQSFVIQSGSEVTDLTTLTTAAMSSTLLEVLDADIDLDGSTEAAEVVTFSTVLADLNLDSTTVTLGFDGTSVSFTMDSSGTVAELAAGLSTALSTAGIGASAADSGSDVMTLTFTDKGQHSDFTLSDGSTSLSSGDISVTTQGIDNASTAINTIDRALQTVAAERATLGATQSQLESTVRNLANVAENTAAAAGRIMDTDYAAETANLTKAQILQQAATSVLAQANAQPQAILSLLQ